tara:strand:+ start:1154 stop:2242 length:1089 start_codon:yes stop_codon:yes gene_type:complete
MKFKKKLLIATGGTGGHIFPAYALGKFFLKKNFSVKIITDKRGSKFLKNYQDIDLTTINSSTIYSKNFLIVIFSFLKIILATIKSLIILIKFKPKIVFGMGGYSSFPICIAAKILQIPFIIYENNTCIGRTNKFLLPLSQKLFVSYDDLEGINKKYKDKIVKIGNILRDEIFDFKDDSKKSDNDKIGFLILGGSQAAKSFGEKLPYIFKRCSQFGIKLKVYQQCLPSQKKFLQDFYNQLNIENEIFNFSKDLTKYFKKINLAITRAGSSMLAELLNCNIPIISVPLPSSADNHQLKNANYFEKKGYGIMIEEDKIENNLFPLIKLMHKDKKLLKKIKSKQKEHTDREVFKRIFGQTKKYLNE